MSYTGPSTVVSTADEFITHWTGVNASLAPDSISVVLEGATTLTTLANLVTLRNVYNTVQVQPGTSPAAPLPAPQFSSIQTLSNQEETGRTENQRTRVSVAEAVGAFVRKVRGVLGHTTFPAALPASPSAQDALADLLAAGDDMISLWTTIDAQPASPLFTPPLTAVVTQPGTNTAVALTLAAAGARVDALKASAATDRKVADGLAAMRPFRDRIWENQIHPILSAYQARVRGDFPTDSPFVMSLPRIYPGAGSTPDAVTATGAWNAGTNQARIAWNLSVNPALDRYQIRQSPGTTYNADAATVLGNVPAGGATELFTDAGLAAPGESSSFRVYVILATGNEKGSNPVTVTRP